MKFLIQRVKYTKVYIDELLHSEIGNGLLIFAYFAKTDNINMIEPMVKKVVNLRIFEDENKKFNLSLKNVNGSVMIVSQFTLGADIKKGNRPSFFEAMTPQEAQTLYEYTINSFKKHDVNTQSGIFGAFMKIELLNYGPTTIIIDFNDI